MAVEGRFGGVGSSFYNRIMQSSALARIEKQVALLTRDEQIELAAWVAELVAGKQTPSASKHEVEWEKIEGIVKDGPEPLEFQRRARAEWDRDSA